MHRFKTMLVLACVTVSMWVAAPADATECTNGKPCPPACQLNKELYIDENGNVGWGGSGRPIDCYV